MYQVQITRVEVDLPIKTCIEENRGKNLAQMTIVALNGNIVCLFFVAASFESSSVPNLDRFSPAKGVRKNFKIARYFSRKFQKP
jgi:hypothetical protein